MYLYVCVRGGPNEPLHRDPCMYLVTILWRYTSIFIVLIYWKNFVKCLRDAAYVNINCG
jgi:hypothetical protein